MVSKKNIKVLIEKNRDEKQRFSIRKLSIGAASVLVGLTFMGFGGQGVAAATDDNITQEISTTQTTKESSTDEITATNIEEDKGSEAGVAAFSDEEVTQKARYVSEDESLNNTAIDVSANDGDEEIQATNQDEQKPEARTVKADTTTTAEELTSVDVSTAAEFVDAIQNGTANVINIVNDIDLGDVSHTKIVKINNKRSITIQSKVPGQKKTLDLNGYTFTMRSWNGELPDDFFSVTYKDLSIYGRNYFGPIRSANEYILDNVDYTGSQFIFSTVSTNVTFKNNVTAHSVDSYVSPLSGKTFTTQTKQQVLQFSKGTTNNIVITEGSNVTLTTDHGNVIQNEGNGLNLSVQNGATVTLNPHSPDGNLEDNQYGDGIPRAIYSAGGTIDVAEGGNLVINLQKNPGDAVFPGAIYLTSGATINNNGNIKINVDGQPGTGTGAPVYIAGTSGINVGSNGTFEIAANNLGTYDGGILSVNGNGKVELATNSIFKISGDGTGAVTGIELGGGGTFTSDRPQLFDIDLTQNNNANKSLIKNGTINFTHIKNTNVDKNYQSPLGKVDLTYDTAGNVTNYEITSEDKDTIGKVSEYLLNHRDRVTFVPASTDITLSDVKLDKDRVLTGTVTAAPDPDGDGPIYIIVTVNGTPVKLNENDVYTVYIATKDGNVSEENKPYATTTGNTGGTFSIDLSSIKDQLTEDAVISVMATRNFVDSNTVNTVAELRDIDTTKLKELVNESDDIKAKPQYYNADPEKQKAYDQAVAEGKSILMDPVMHEQSEIDAARKVIEDAKNALDGTETDKSALEAAVKADPGVKSDENYISADEDLKKAYDDAVTAGQEVLDNPNATQSEVDKAVADINNAKTALNGEENRVSLQAVVNDAATTRQEPSYYNDSADAKKAYDDAITAGQEVLDNPNATAQQIKDAKKAIEDAKNALDGTETDKRALEAAVKADPGVKSDENYISADEDLKKAYDDAVTAGQEVLNNLNATQSEVDKAVVAINNTKGALNGIINLKNAANTSIDEALKAKTDEINAADHLTDDEKQELIDKATTVADEAKDQITSAQTSLEIETAKGTGVKNITDIKVPTAEDKLQEAKNAANTAIDEALKAKTDEINAADYLTDDEKQELIDKATTAADEAKDQVASAQTIPEVETARDTGVETIKNIKVPTAEDKLQEAKDAANKAIDEALKAKTDEINAADYLTDDEKQELIDKATTAADEAKKKIADATTTETVTAEREKGVTAIESVEVPAPVEDELVNAKNDAIAEINKALGEKIDEINGAGHLTAEEKQTLIDQAASVAEEAKKQVTDATTTEEVTIAKDKGVDDITSITVPADTLSQAKTNGINAINDARDAKKNEIDGTDNLSQPEKDVLKQQIDQIADNAINAINASKTEQEVSKAEKAGIDDIHNVKVPSLDEIKNNAKQAVVEALEKKLKEIENASNLDSETKDALTKQANDEADVAYKNIDASTTSDEALVASKSGVSAIENITVPTIESAVTKALTEIQEALTNKLNEIAKASHLSQSQKDDLISKANNAADDAIKAVNESKTDSEVEQAAKTGVAKINAIVVPGASSGDDKPITTLDDIKNQAYLEIEQVLATKTNEINAADHISDDAKQTLIKQAKDAADKAKSNIGNANSEEEVTTAKNSGISEIKSVTVPAISDAKQDAIDEIEEAAKAKKEEIDSSSLTQDEKNDLMIQLNKLVNDAKANINSANTLQAIETIKDKAIAAIKALELAIDGKPDNGNASNGSNTAKPNDSANGQNMTNMSNGSHKGNVDGQSTEKAQLPETGKSNNVAATVAGALAAMTGLISLLGTNKKKKD